MAENQELIRLTSTDTELVLAPGIGGSVVSLRIAEVDILRPSPREAIAKRDPRELAAFPLFPFSGRIENARFRWGAHDIALRPNLAPEPHAIHGQAWLGAWQLDERRPAAASLSYEHTALDWPWPYRAEQHFVITPRGLALSMSLCNLSDTPMPAGLGWHPFFPEEGALLGADVRRVWPSGDDMIPDVPTSLSPANDLRSIRPVKGLDLDDCFDVGDGPSRIRWPARECAVALEASAELRHLVVYTPPGKSFFCVEPVSHVPNSVNSALTPDVTGQRVLQPAETLRAKIALRVVPSNDEGAHGRG